MKINKLLLLPGCFALAAAMASCADNAGGEKSYYDYRMNPGYTGEAPMLEFHSGFGGKFTGTPNRFSPDPLIAAQWDRVSETDKLELYELYPVKVSSETPDAFEGLASATEDKTEITVRGAGDIMVDFGVESAAWLEFDSPDMSGEVEMSISEYNKPARLNAGAQNINKTLKPVKYGNTYRLELNRELHEGVRFGWIHVRKFDRPFTITGIRKVAQAKPVNYDGSFECDDPMLNRIWYTGAYGVRVNMLYDYISPILMERSDRYSWAGDAHLIQAAALVAFGDYPHVKQNLEHNRFKGQGIESYEMIWVKSVVDYYYHTGETEFFKSYIDPMREKLDHGYGIFDSPAGSGAASQGNYIGWDERLGAGFEWHQNPMNLRNYQFLWIESARLAAGALGQASETALAEEYETKAREKFAKLAENPAFLDGLDIHAAAAAINTGLLTPEQERKLFDERYLDRLHRVSFSPFNGYFILESMARMGEYGKIFETIDDCWGSQIRYGGTTFFEVFHPSWADVLPQNNPIPNTQCGYTSLCHPWSAGVTRWMSDEILGVTPLTPGYARTMIKPNPVNLKRVKGSVPTPKGVIGVEFDFEKGTAEVTIPAGITATLAFPKRGQEIVEITDNGGNPLEGTIRSDQTHVYIDGIAEGRHSYGFTARGTFEPVKMAPPIQYVTTGSQPESLSWDEGYRKYGRDGFVLFTPGGDTEILPSYIKSVGVADNNVDLKWMPLRIPMGKPVAYRDAEGREVEVGAGMLVTNNPIPCQQSFTIDIRRSEEVDYTLTLYVDTPDGSLAEQEGFELFDLDTLELLSPLSVVSEPAGGKFVSFAVDRDVRIRMYHIWGEQAVLGGLLFTK